jgi:hypothetical protein
VVASNESEVALEDCDDVDGGNVSCIEQNTVDNGSSTICVTRLILILMDDCDCDCDSDCDCCC